MSRRALGALLLAVGVGLSVRVAASDWPQWRGPNRDGVAPDARLPEPWPAQLRVVWQAQVGTGYSAPVVAQGRLVVLARQNEQEVILCLNEATGQELWRDTYDAPYEPSEESKAHGKGPFATPTIAGNRVYTSGVSGVVSCLDFATGKVVWRQLHKSFGSPSPLIEGRLLIHGVFLQAPQGSTGALLGLNKETGDMEWRLGVGMPAYASAVVADLAGQRQVVAVTQKHVVGLTPDTGTLLWEVPFAVENGMNIVTPVVCQDRVIFSGYLVGTKAVRIQAVGGKVTAEPAWHNEGTFMTMSSPVIAGEHLYAMAMLRGGSLVCLRLADGQRAWASQGKLGEYASLVRVGDKLLALTCRGELLVVAADPAAYRELGRCQVGTGPTWGHLALAGSRLYVRDGAVLRCLDLSAQ